MPGEMEEDDPGNLPTGNEEQIPFTGIHGEFGTSVPKDQVVENPRGKKVSVMQRLRTDLVYRENFLLSLSICWSFVALGWLIGLAGPVFLDIQILTGTTLDKASGFFTAASMGYLLGSLISGILYDRFNKTLLLAVYLFVGVIVNVALPWCFWYELMMAVQFCEGIYSGGLDTGGNALMISTWGSEEHSFMHILHFVFAIGGIVSPLVTAPFLLEEKDDARRGEHNIVYNASDSDFRNNTSEILLYNDSNSSNIIDVTVSTIARYTSDYKPEDTKIYIPYCILATVMLSSAVFLLVMFIRERRRKSIPAETNLQDASKRISMELPFGFKFLVLFCLCLFLGLYCTVEDTFTSFLTTFCVKHMGWSKAQASSVTSMFWASFGLGRFLGIWLIKCILAENMVCIFTVAIGVVFAVLLTFAYFLIDAGIWVCAVCAGVAMSIIFPTTFCWTEEKLLPVSGKIASLFLISASLGSMINPIVLGHLMGELSPMWFTYLLFGESVVLIVLVFIILVLARICENRFGSGCSVEDPTIEINLQDDVENEESALNRH